MTEFLVNVDASRWKVKPDDIRVNLPELRQRTGVLIAKVIAVLYEHATRSENGPDFVD
jgi:hypothetical protein